MLLIVISSLNYNKIIDNLIGDLFFFYSSYGLLGASGSGKSTLLSCIVGICKLDAGKVWVLGGQPGTINSSVPGPKIGYMPQDISLVQEFSTLDALYYFGRINGMKDCDIKEKYTFLSNLLQLPPKNRLIKQMSGGQQRRISFACALLHEPELLILDEPTVGLDPVIRDKIWQFLVNLTKTNGTTIVITTHYIEEAKQSDIIGLLRNGKLLSETSPDELLEKCNCESLEEAFLMLSQKQNNHQADEQNEMEEEEDEIDTQLDEILQVNKFDENCNLSSTENFEKTEKIELSNNKITNISKFKKNIKRNRRFEALMIKNFYQLIRHPGSILFAIVFPIVQVYIFFTAIGNDPVGLKIGIVNNEAGNCNNSMNNGKIIYSSSNNYDDYNTCNYIDLSCRFINSFTPQIADAIYYNDVNTAVDSVKHGHIIGVIFFSDNFSSAFYNKTNFDGNIIDDGNIQVSLDMSNQQIGLYLEKKLYEIFYKTFDSIMIECHTSIKLGHIPMRFEKPIFGSNNQKYSSTMAPGFLLTSAFFLATSVASSIIISDRHEGIWNRSLTQGVKTSEILIAHIMTQTIVIIIQVTLTLSMTFIKFDLECRGSMITVVSLVMLIGICGMSYGFLISILCTSHTIANFITTGSFYPVILLCGCIWPIEAMPILLQWFSLMLPTTIPALSLKNILDRGYTFYDPQVYQGFFVISGWTAALVLFCFFGLRAKSL